MFRQLRVALRTGVVTEPPPAASETEALGARVSGTGRRSNTPCSNIVPDFPLCNKSFNLSYAGSDL
jgi:hypothetical protein